MRRPAATIAGTITRDLDTADTAIIRTVKDDLDGWGLRRLVWVADRGFASAANRAYLTRGGGHYIHAEKLRHTNTEAAAAHYRAAAARTTAIAAATTRGVSRFANFAVRMNRKMPRPTCSRPTSSRHRRTSRPPSKR